MATYAERRRRSRNATGTAIAAGIFVILCGLYFIFGISAQTNRKIAECTDRVTGVVTDVRASGSKYLTTIEYTPGYSPETITRETKKQYEVGTELTVNYDPMSWSNVYIEGITPTGAKDRVTGLVMLLAGAALTFGGVMLMKMDKKDRSRCREGS